MKGFDFYIEQLTDELNSYELKMFRVQHDETQLVNYLKKFAKKHHASNVNKIYLVRYSATGQIAAWFGLKAATLPYNDIGDSLNSKKLPAQTRSNSSNMLHQITTKDVDFCIIL